MEVHTLNGGCHCGNISIDISLSASPATRNPRVCDCDFCRKHGASYISDPLGSLRIEVKEEIDFRKYKHGSGIADFLICKNCGVLVGCSYLEDGQLYATVNSRAIDGAAHFGEETVVSPKLLSEAKKTERWKENWFRHVVINIRQSGAA